MARDNAIERGAPPDRGAALALAAALLWLPQAAGLALGIDALAAGGGLGAAAGPAALVLALGALRAGLEAWGGRLSYRRARALLTAARARALTVLAEGSPFDPRRHPAGLAASVLAEQAEAVLPFLQRFRPVQWRVMAVPLAIAAVVGTLSWVAALILLVAAPLIPVFMALVGWRAKAASEAQMVELGGMNAFLLDRLRGLATIRGLNAVAATAERLDAAARGLQQRTMAVLRIAFLSSAVLELFSALGVAMVAVYVGFHLLGQLAFGAWGGVLSLGEGLFILLLAPAFFEPLRDLSAVWHDRAAGAAGVAALEGLLAPGLDLPGALDPAPARQPGPAPAVTVEALRFRHAGAAAAVLDGFALALKPGEKVALMAPSGAGKSTLLALIAGLLVPESGRVLIGGQVLGAENAAALRAGMAWIGQRPHVFPGSMRANIALGRAGVGPAAVAAAIETAALAPVGGTDGARVLGEGGLGLSGGEVLRLAIARAAATPHLGLILADEPTAHLDAETAQAVTAGLLRLAEGRGLIVATHDPVLAAAMDRVIHLNPPGDAPCAAVA
ncbi:thiol reductant ABC exporter subunit CydD [Zavarzinia compransoris]|uniref:Thiol reductant ABC exporter subunit CydD n=1 Tax=Zavarzinia compransoris TaxID=1264899 RepID=A0A317DZ20_9PROT|nr:thiol reductant ABC exporter subunit CydD [Zavarzinia compransoris]PWR19651.1 thiol reductant ABC exporter subunit CydD [Zavarzinia compransoris]TDP43407.1 ATP-binding cassette subfamily C protein CydD [Zavarzinia compransoris]